MLYFVVGLTIVLALVYILLASYFNKKKFNNDDWPRDFLEDKFLRLFELVVFGLVVTVAGILVARYWQARDDNDLKKSKVDLADEMNISSICNFSKNTMTTSTKTGTYIIGLPSDSFEISIYFSNADYLSKLPTSTYKDYIEWIRMLRGANTIVGGLPFVPEGTVYKYNTFLNAMNAVVSKIPKEIKSQEFYKKLINEKGQCL